MLLRRLLAASLLLACCAGQAAAGSKEPGTGAQQGKLGPSWYKCDPLDCRPADNCQCPTTAPPGGLSPKDTPQFVVITHDDAVNGLSNKVVRRVTDGHRNPNGCNVPATWFVLEAGSDCELAKQLWEDNHEMATHTVSHFQMRPSLAARVNFTEEIVGGRDYLVGCGIPQEAIRGFRAPYLIHNPLQRKVLSEAGFLYDSSINEHFPSATSPDKNSRLWPYTMDWGIPQDCSWTAPDGNCTKSERYPGLWEVPIWDMQDARGKSIATMDPPGNESSLLTLLTNNFKYNYYGGRAPMGIFVHAPWFNTETTAATNKFIEWALAQPDVWFVTMSQVIEWMRDPVPASQVGARLKCNKVDLKPPETKYCQLYTVQEGDYLYLLATKFGVSTTEVLKLNPSLGDGTALRVGQPVRIPPWNSGCGEGAPVATPQSVAAPPSPAPPSCRSKVVQNGDYLYAIAAEFGVSIDGILEVNLELGNGNALRPGQQIRIPPWGANCTLPAGPAPATLGSSAAADGSPSGVPAPPPLPTCRKWAVKQGDFLFAIADNTSATVEEIAALNRLNPNKALMEGQILLIPPYPPCCNASEGCPKPPPPPAPPTPAPSPVPATPAAPASGLRATFSLSGATLTTWQADLRGTFKATLARLLSVDPAAIIVTGVRVPGADSAPLADGGAGAPAPAPAVRRALLQEGAAPLVADVMGQLLQGAGAAPPAGAPADAEVDSAASVAGAAPLTPLEVTLVIATNDPVALYLAAQTALAADKVDEGLAALGLSLTQDPLFEPFQDGKPLPLPSPAPAPAPATPTPAAVSGAALIDFGAPGSSGSRGLPAWAVGSVAAGLAAAALAAAALGTVAYQRRRRTAGYERTPSSAPALGCPAPASYRRPAPAGLPHPQAPAGSPMVAGGSFPGGGEAPAGPAGPAMPAGFSVVVKGCSTPTTPSRRSAFAHDQAFQ